MDTNWELYIYNICLFKDVTIWLACNAIHSFAGFVLESIRNIIIKIGIAVLAVQVSIIIEKKIQKNRIYIFIEF